MIEIYKPLNIKPIKKYTLVFYPFGTNMFSRIKPKNVYPDLQLLVSIF